MNCAIGLKEYCQDTAVHDFAVLCQSECCNSHGLTNILPLLDDKMWSARPRQSLFELSVPRFHESLDDVIIRTTPSTSARDIQPDIFTPNLESNKPPCVTFVLLN